MISPFTYMGTKKQIANDVAGVIAQASRGPLLDLFCGISSVGLAVAPHRQIWCNDAQRFAYSLATAAFTSKEQPKLDSELLAMIVEKSRWNEGELKEEYAEWFLAEQALLQHPRIQLFTRLNLDLVRQCVSGRKSKHLRSSRRKKPRDTPYCLFTTTYAGGYVGIEQAIVIDSLRFAFDNLLFERAINAELHRWFLLALCRALAKVTSTTGHFAQYLKVNENTFKRIGMQRKRSIFFEWLQSLNELRPVGNSSWRQKNKTFCSSASSLLKMLARKGDSPAVIYADPPYTADHYSRYYHLWDTLLLYDYPEPSGKGMYRPDRFVSNYSLRTKVEEEFQGMISQTAEIGAALVINYPKVGVLSEPRKTLLKTLRKYFSHAEIALEIPHSHSTLGASKGEDKAKVTELIFYAH